QVVRKSTIQSTFRELHSFVQDSLILRPMPGALELPEVDGAVSFTHTADIDAAWALDSTQLRRGQLLEVDIELSADENFRASVIFSTALEMINELPHMPNLDIEGLRNARAGTVLLEKMLVGLVPLRGRAVDYVVVETNGRQLVVHIDALARHNLDGA